MKVSWKTEWPHCLILTAMFALAAACRSVVPDKIPVHWNISGEVDRYGGKVEGLLGLPVIAVVLYGLFLLLPRLDPGRANYSQFTGAYNAIRLSNTMVLMAVYGAILLVATGHKIEVPSVASIATGILFIVLGGVMGKLRPNWFTGIRTPWTLSSKTAWVQTHRLAGWLFVVAGAVQILLSFLLSASTAIIVTLPLLITGSIGLCIYSYFVWRDDPEKIPPAGTLPGL